MSRHTNIVAAYLVLQKDDQVLLLQRQNTGYEDGNYSVIAGHVEPGETFTQAIIREAREEANVVITQNNIVSQHVQHRKSLTDRSERVDVYYLVKDWQGQVENLEPHKCRELKWFALDDLPKNTIACVKQALECLLKEQGYSEFGWNSVDVLE